MHSRHYVTFQAIPGIPGSLETMLPPFENLTKVYLQIFWFIDKVSCHSHMHTRMCGG